MKKLLVKILSKFLQLRTRWRGNLPHFRRAVRKAERLAAQKGKRTYVYFIGGKYRTFNRKDIKALKNAGVLKRSMNIATMNRICLYDTLTKTNSHPQFKNAKL
jgi:hypothetical protein